MYRSFEGCKLSREDAELLDRFSVYDDGDVEEATNLCAAVHFFGEAMKKKLIRKLAEEDFSGWDEVSRSWGIRLRQMLRDHCDKLGPDAPGGAPHDPEAEVDIANLAMFHHFLREARREEAKASE